LDALELVKASGSEGFRVESVDQGGAELIPRVIQPAILDLSYHSASEDAGPTPNEELATPKQGHDLLFAGGLVAGTSNPGVKSLRESGSA
jgi:hypothetical protein